MGVAKINESPEILPTTQVEIARVDTWANGSMSQKSNYYSGGAAAVAAEEAVGIISDFVAAYGAFWSESTKAVAGVLGKHAIPMCGDIQGDLDLSNKDAYPTFFRIYPGPGIERHILLLLEAWSVTRLVVLVGLDRKNKAVCEAMTNLLALAGIEVLSVIDIQPSQKFPKRLQPQQANNVVHLIQQYDARYILTFVDNVDLGPIYFKANTNTEPYQLLNQSWHEEYMLDPSPVLSPYLNLTAVVGAYDCVNTLLYGINKEPNESISKLEKQVQELPLYPTAFNNTGYQGAYTNPIILNTGTGDLVIAYKFIDLGSLNAFAETNLEGTFLKIIGSVQFNGAPPNSPAPPDGPPIKDPVILPDSPTGRTMLAGILLGLLITVFIAIMLIQHRSNQVFVKAAPIFSGLVLVGAALSYGSIATFMGYPTHLTCHLRLWLQLLAFIVSLSAFMIKNFRIHKIFSSRTIIPKSKLSNERFASFMMTFIFMEVVLLSAWSALSNPKSTSATTYNVNFSYQCLPNNEKLDAIMSGLLYCYNSFVLLLTAILAYLTRHVNSDYNESLFMLFFVVASALTAGPTLLALQQESDAIQRIIIRNVAIWIFTTFALIIFFAPKILAIYTFDAKPKLRLIDIISSKKYSGSTSSKGRHHHGKAMIVRPGWNKSNISSDSRRSSRWSLNETKVALDCKASTMSIFHVSEEALNSYEVLKMKN
ncbi:7 transmembrane sweet-taste receptor of 3 GCPR-domain-containing protein [Chytriomyces sp. MP71]|nr:7 transmembrane sweet-taste receptor of 3 GCPR-domain-containing protein [Chytriomyces sp. MP71]